MIISTCEFEIIMHFDITFCRPGSSTQPIWSRYMYSTSYHSCFGTGNTCPLNLVTGCSHSEDVTVECSKA